MQQKVSVVMNTVNEDVFFLQRSIESYIQQVRVDMQLLISTVSGDKNIPFIQNKYPEIQIVEMPKELHPSFHGIKSPKGSFLQLNNALPFFKGEWFTFAGGNDYAYSNKLATEIELCIKREKEICYSAYDYINENNELIKKIYFREYDYEKHFIGNFVADSSIVSKRLVDKYLPFRVELNNYAYWDLWLRIFEGEGDVFCYNNHPTWAYMQDENSMHIKRWKDEKAMAEAEMDKERMLNLHR